MNNDCGSKMMIHFSKDILRLFEVAERIDEERVANLLNSIQPGGGVSDNDCSDSTLSEYGLNQEWDSHRQCIYEAGGVIRGMYREQNALMLQCLDLEPDRKSIVELLNWDQEQIIRQAVGKLNDYLESIRTKAIENAQRIEYPPLTEGNILDWIKSYNCCILDTSYASERGSGYSTEHLSDNQKLMFLYILYGYDYYRFEKNSSIQIEQPRIKKLYGRLDDHNYKKYELIPIDDERELIIREPCRIYDRNLDKTIIIKYKFPNLRYYTHSGFLVFGRAAASFLRRLRYRLGQTKSL